MFYFSCYANDASFCFGLKLLWSDLSLGIHSFKVASNASGFWSFFIFVSCQSFSDSFCWRLDYISAESETQKIIAL